MIKHLIDHSAGFDEMVYTVSFAETKVVLLIYHSKLKTENIFLVIVNQASTMTK